ncbi:MAG: DNA replication and repair protein RecF [Chitinophagales bacterium]|nr:DNA replication and repair protein RecF [Chitinophagales bacterium]
MDKGLFIEHLLLRDFKNYPHLELKFDNNLVAFAGENGVGKTNILDAIYYICTTKSYLNTTEQFNFRHGQIGMFLQADVHLSDRDYIVQMKVVKGRKKEIQLNQVKEDKLTQYIGKFPVVMIAPNDNMIILGSSEERRKLIDNILCQSDYNYLEELMQYNKILANRNALLKQMAEQSSMSSDLLETLDLMLSNIAEPIYLKRKAFVEKFSVKFEKIYHQISQRKENIAISYKSHLHDKSLLMLLKSQRTKDILLQRTSSGIHLDDLDFTLDNQPLKKVGSQGQQKTYVVAMKLALYYLLSDRKKVSPILLLDDIFEKFDENRVEQLFKVLSEHHYGQIFITDTHEERLSKMLSYVGKTFEIYKLGKDYVKKEG